MSSSSPSSSNPHAMSPPPPTSGSAPSGSRSRNRITNLFKQSIMNRFLTRKRGKKAPAEPKFELNLDTALPSTDNFRTSLLMPNLSARFSMLREQDDPNSMLGKASDDSVLQPRRQSRLHEFGYMSRGLSDIAEVSSIASFKPPFAESGRSHSVSSDAGYGTDDDSMSNGSIMNRTRPLGDGNMLFGGRQKVYMISATGSEASIGSGLKGRALYDDDLSLSAFQRQRRKEKEEREEKERLEAAAKEKVEDTVATPKQAAISPSTTSSLQRQASSSTITSTPSIARSSSAATSINSQGATSVPPSAPTSVSSQASSPSFAPPMERPSNKARRLYEQGLDREIKEQQSTSMTRLNSIQRTRGINGRTTPDHVNRGTFKPAQDRLNRAAFPFPSPTPSPPSTAIQENAKPFQSNRSFTPVHDLCPSPPLTPFHEEDERDAVLKSALQPGDRGKATAMGAFNKPQQFSEQKYMERQMTLNKGRTSPTQKMGPPPRDASPKKSILKNSNPEAPQVTRPRALSDKEDTVPTAFSVFQKAASQLKSPQPYDTDRKDSKQFHSVLSPSTSDSEGEDVPKPAPAVKSPPPAIHTAAANRIRNQPIPVVSPSQAPPKHEHPAFRSAQEDDQSNEAETDCKAALTSPEPHDHSSESPTLGITNGGLSGLVRQHLRNVSNISERSQSSIYPADNPPALSSRVDEHLTIRTDDMNIVSSASDTPAHSSYSHSNPWDLEDYEGTTYADADSLSSVSPVDGPRSRQAGGTIDALGINGDHRRRALSPHALEPPSELSWQHDVKRTRARRASTDTAQERIAFQNELDARRRAIQEKLKDKVETEQRSTSPTPSKSGTFKKIDMLRTMSSRESFKTGPGAERGGMSKSMKVLGLSGSSTNLAGMSSTSLHSFDRSASVERPSVDEWRFPGQRSNSRPPVARSNRSANNSPPPSQHSMNGYRSVPEDDEQRRDPNSQKGYSPPESTRNSMRSRSNSELSNGRSRSRNGRYRDDLERAMAEGTSSRTTIYPAPSPVIPEHCAVTNNAPQYITPDRRIYQNEPVMRSNGVNATSIKSPSAFESKGLFPPPHQPAYLPSSSPSPRPSPGFSPGIPSSPRPAPGTAISTGAMLSPSFPRSPAVMSGSQLSSPSPFSPYSAHSTPAVSQTTTPVVPNFAAATAAANNVPAAFRAKSAPRKRSVQKSDISEPTLISTTSVIDTVDLPVGASLRNGIDDAPPLPPMNPRRRKFGFGRADTPEPPNAQFMRGDTQSHSADESERPFRPRHRLRKSSSEGAKIGMRLRAQQQQQHMDGALNPDVANGVLCNSPPRMVEGAMF